MVCYDGFFPKSRADSRQQRRGYRLARLGCNLHFAARVRKYVIVSSLRARCNWMSPPFDTTAPARPRRNGAPSSSPKSIDRRLHWNSLRRLQSPQNAIDRCGMGLMVGIKM